MVDSRHVLVEQDDPPGVLEINRDISDRKRAEDQRAEVMTRLAVLLEVSESLSAAATPDEIVEILLEKAVPALGAYAGSVAVLTARRHARWKSWAHAGIPRRLRTAFARFPVTASTPLSDAIRTGTVVAVSSPEEWHSRYPHLAPDRVGTAEPRARGHSSCAAAGSWAPSGSAFAMRGS